MRQTRSHPGRVTLCIAVVGAFWPWAAGEAKPPCGALVQCQAFRGRGTWPAAIKPDSRAELLAPVNVVRIYSDEHSAEQVARNTS